MNFAVSFKGIVLTGAAVFALSTIAAAQTPTPTPEPGYFDIPKGFDFPADKQTLEQYRKTGNLSAQRKHVWNVFAGMTQPTPDNKFAIFETWYGESEAFAPTGPSPQALAPRRVVRDFTVPQQFLGVPGLAAPQAAGSALLSEVMFNFKNYNHIRTNRLFLKSQLTSLITTGAKDPEIANDTTVPAFPAESISLKTVWWPVARDKPTPMPIWDPATNPANTNGNDYPTWSRAVVVDPTRTNIPPNETMNISFHGPKPNSHVVGLDKFHRVIVDATMAANINANPRLKNYIADVFSDTSVFGPNGRQLQAGDYIVFIGTHLTTKEIDDWVWATFWWHDRPDDGPFAADRTDNVKGVWRNYLMSSTYDLNLPLDDGKPHIAFNPWLEARFEDDGHGGGTVSNCMNCHHRAAFRPTSFLPIFRGNPDPTDAAYAAGKARADYLWSVVLRAH